MKAVATVGPQLEPLEKAWLRKAVETQRNVLVRSRTKEMVGSDIWNLRGKEIEQLNVLVGKLS